MTLVAKGRAALVGVLALCAGFVATPVIHGIGTEDAHAVIDSFSNIPVNNGNRVIGHYFYLYGVGWYKGAAAGDDIDNVCIGAKTSSDGSGGNAIPFLCTQVAYDQTRWTPGGQSNYGYPTAIANADPDGFILGAGMMNRR